MVNNETLINGKINLVSAHKGKIQLSYAENSLDMSVASADEMWLAKFMLDRGFENDDKILMSSSMDYASEYGFERNGDARKLFDSALNLYSTMRKLGITNPAQLLKMKKKTNKELK